MYHIQKQRVSVTVRQATIYTTSKVNWSIWGKAKTQQNSLREQERLFALVRVGEARKQQNIPGKLLDSFHVSNVTKGQYYVSLITKNQWLPKCTEQLLFDSPILFLKALIKKEMAKHKILNTDCCKQFPQCSTFVLWTWLCVSLFCLLFIVLYVPLY